jgi:hypothetical protein
MQHSHWHIEMCAREMMDRRQREAELARRVHAASAPRRQTASGDVVARIGRLLHGAQRRIWSRDVTPETTLPAATESAELAREVASRVMPKAIGPVHRSRQNDPYAAMTIVARGYAFAPAEEPCPVRE